jgi:membrane associated rhomboid family serine protease
MCGQRDILWDTVTHYILHEMFSKLLLLFVCLFYFLGDVARMKGGYEEMGR